MPTKLTLFAFLLVVSFQQITAQTTIYYQNFDAVPPMSMPDFWSSTTGTTQVMDNTPYSGLPNDHNLFLANCQPAGELRIVSLSNVNTTNKQDISISFAHRRTGGFDSPITLEWSNNGTNWNNIAYDYPGTPSVWDFYTSPTLPAGASNQANLRFRWSWATNTNAGCVTAVPNFRMDEVTIGAFPLPISLLDLQVKTDHQSNFLYFSTASERNNAYFAIERAADNNHFTEIDQIRGAGNALETQNYAYTDKHPLKGINYYRLRQVDFDGESTYSQVVSTTVGKAGNWSLSPSPATQYLQLSFEESLSESATYEIVDLFGRPMLQGVFVAENGTQRIEVAALPQGFYVLRVKNEQFMLAKQFQKQ